MLRLLVVALLVALIGAAAYWWGGNLVAAAPDNTTAFAIGAFALVLVVVASAIVVRRRLKHQRMLLREAQRVVADNHKARPAEPSPPAETAEIGKPAPEMMALLGTIERAQTRRDGDRPVMPEHDIATRLAPNLYYQPIVTLPDAEVTGYDVFRKVERRDVLAEPAFVQTPSLADAQALAAFEMEMIQNAIAAARQVFSEADPSTRGATLHVHVTSALLDDANRWSTLAKLLAAHPSLSAQITLCIADAALVNTRSARLDALDQMLDADAGLGVTGLEFSPDALPDYMTRALQVAIYENGALEAADDDGAARRRDCLNQLARLGIKACARGLVSDADVIDAIQQGAQLGSGPVFAEPRRLRDEPRRVG